MSTPRTMRNFFRVAASSETRNSSSRASISARPLRSESAVPLVLNST